jgi:hypothetical protein
MSNDAKLIENENKTTNIEKEILPIQDFLKLHTAYELLPESGKVIVLDVKLTVSDAFKALAENGITSAPLFDSYRLEYAGMLTVSDFIEILIDIYSHIEIKVEKKDEFNKKVEEEFNKKISNFTIREWREKKLSKEMGLINRPLPKDGDNKAVNIEQSPTNLGIGIYFEYCFNVLI